MEAFWISSVRGDTERLFMRLLWLMLLLKHQPAIQLLASHFAVASYLQQFSEVSSGKSVRAIPWRLSKRDRFWRHTRNFPIREMGQKPKEEQEILMFRKIHEDKLRSYDHVTLVFDAVDQSGSPDRLVRLALSLADQLFNLNVQSRVLITSQQEIAWPETADHGLSSTVLSIIREDLAIDVTNSVRHCTDTMQPPMDNDGKLSLLRNCLKQQVLASRISCIQ